MASHKGVQFKHDGGYKEW